MNEGYRWRRLTRAAPLTQEETKAVLKAAPAAWCAAEVCRLDVSQEGNTILVASPDGGSRLARCLARCLARSHHITLTQGPPHRLLTDVALLTVN